MAMNDKELDQLEERNMTSVGRVMLCSGRLVCPWDMTPEDIDVRDIVQGLSHLYRYGGQADPGLTVAEHCLLVHRIVRALGGSKEQQVYALLHDACEAYLHDIPAPIKRFFFLRVKGVEMTYDDVERRILSVVAEGFGLPSGPEGFDDPLVREGDLYAREIERVGMRNMRWNEPEVPSNLRHLGVSFWGPTMAGGMYRRALQSFGVA